MIDPTGYDWAGDNTSRGKKKAAVKWAQRLALVVLGFLLFTMIIWSV
jgi:hypothetical protein